MVATRVSIEMVLGRAMFYEAEFWIGAAVIVFMLRMTSLLGWPLTEDTRPGCVRRSLGCPWWSTNKEATEGRGVGA